MASGPTLTRLDQADFPSLPMARELCAALNRFMVPTAQALAGGLTIQANVASYLKTLTLTCPEDWRDLVASDMRNSWQLYPSNASPTASFRLRLRKGSDGMIDAAGLAIPPTVSATGIVFAWPSGYEPAQEEIFGLQGENLWAQVRTKTAGAEVTSRETGAAPPQGWVSFSGMRYRAADRTPPAWPTPLDIAMPDTFRGRVGAVMVWACQEVDSQAPVASVSADGWRILPTNSTDARQVVRLPRINGLAPGKRYTLTLLFLPE